MKILTLQYKQKTSYKNKAFSLAEMLVVMLILCLVMAASMPIITKKKHVETEPTPINISINAPNAADTPDNTPTGNAPTGNTSHGNAEYSSAGSNTCYVNGSSTAGSCDFVPPDGVKSIIIHFPDINGYSIPDQEVTVTPNQPYNLNVGSGSISIKW